MTEIYPDIDYKLCLKDKTQPEFKFTQLLSEWLKSNMEQLTDDNNERIFNRVSLGFNEENLKNFGFQPICDIYIDNIEYAPSFDYCKPSKVTSFIIFYFKASKSIAYYKACEIHDYIMQELLTNEDFIRLDGIVSDTTITASRVTNQSIKKKWGVMGTFELTHNIF